MKTCAVSRLLTLSSAAITLLLPHAVLAQGDLPPPSGAPVPTMKSLDQIEPRKPLIARSAGVSIAPTGTITISEAGSYYLTGNLTVSTGNGIVIETDDVTLDLRGFTIASDAAPAATGDAISFSGERSRISISNGHIRSGVTHSGNSFSNGPGFDSGINWPIQAPHSVRVSGISISGVKNYGIDLGEDDSCIVQACTVRVAGNFGIRAGVVSDCSVTLGGATTISAARVANSVGSRADGTGTGIVTAGATTDGLQAALTQIQTDNQTLALLLSASTVPLAWNLTTVDSGGDVGNSTSLAFGPNGQPAISYYDITNGNLKLARYTGSAWTLSTVDNSAGDVGSFTSLAFGPDGQPAISYYDTTNGNLKFTRFNGSTWTTVTVDNSVGNVGSFTSLAFGPDGQPAISYQDTTGQNLNFARYNGSAWTTVAVDSAGNVGAYTSLAFGPDGQPAISYYDQSNFDLKLARYNGSTWVPVIVNGAAFIGQHNSLAFGPDGHPAISCQIVTSETLAVVRYNGSAWTTSTVDGNSATGLFTSLAFGPDGQPAVSYYFQSTGDLRFARYDGTTWTTTTVEGDGNGSGITVGAHTSLAFGPDGQPAISYRDSTNSDLKFARKGIFRSSP